MKTGLIIILVAVVAGLGGFSAYLVQRDHARAKNTAAIQEQLAAKAKALEELEAERNRADDSQQQLLDLSTRLSTELKVRTNSNPLGGAVATAETNDDQGGLGKLISGMMEDPAMRQMIRDQQRGMLDSMYGPLIAKMGLTPEQAGQFKDIVADHMAKAAERAGSLFGGSSSNRADAVQQIVADQKLLDDQIRGFLGEDRYAQYRQYQDTVQERTQLNAFQQSLGSAALSETQTEQLLGFMAEEKRTALEANAPGLSQEEAGLQAMASEEDSKKLLDAQEKANQRVYDRATGVLTPDQLASFGRFQTNQMSMMRMGMEMARRFMAPKAPGK